MVVRALVMGLGVMCFTAGGGVGVASAAPPQREEISGNTSNYNFCVGEFIGQSGTLYTSTRERADGVVIRRLRGRLTGVGEHGSRYIVTVNGAGTLDYTEFAQRERFITLGRTANQIVIFGDKDPTTNTVQSEYRCVGAGTTRESPI